MIATGGLPPWGRPWRQSSGRSAEFVRKAKAVLRRVESSGMGDLERAQLVLLLRRLLTHDPWDGPRFAA